MKTKIEIYLKNKAVKLIDSFLATRHGLVSYYGRDENRKAFFGLYRQVGREVNFLLNFNEAYQIYMSVKNTAAVPGDIAEVGPYMGGSSKIICEAKGGKAFHVFDTFEGLPPTSPYDGSFGEGDFDGRDYTDDLYSFVKAYLAKYPSVNIYKGRFPETAGPIKEKIFSFVHLDVDLYESTKAGLEFFYPRLSKGGILISHDYENGPGVRKAFDEFFADKPEPVVQLFAGQQCLIVKQ